MKRNSKYIFYKETLIIVFFAHVIFISHGQSKRLIYENEFNVLDTIKYEIMYELVHIKKKTLSDEYYKLVDYQILQIGNDISKYFSELLYVNDSICTIIEEEASGQFPSAPEAAAMYIIFRNKNSKMLTITYRNDNSEVFKYKENIPNIIWKIHNEKKKYMNYTCQKAAVNFRGREYVAWFTSEIPIKEGPYKFGGLPGLILELEDTQQHYVYKCLSIKKLNNIEPIKIRNWPYTKTTRQKLGNFLNKKYKNPYAYYNSLGVQFRFVTKDEYGNFIDAPSGTSLPYNPIELE